MSDWYLCDFCRFPQWGEECPFHGPRARERRETAAALALAALSEEIERRHA